MAVAFSGCYTAVVTPMDSTGAIDYERFREQLRFQAEAGVSGVAICGTTGEAPTLDEHEQERLIEEAVETLRPLGLTVIAGTGSNCTAHAVELQKRAATLGADAGLSVNPYYNKPNQDGLYRHFMAVANAADLPVILYNIPGRTGVALQAETIARLASHPNIVAIKEATGSTDSASEIASRCGITILSGDDSMTLPFMSVGATGVVSVVSNLVPAKVQRLCDRFRDGDLIGARSLHLELFPLARGLLSLDTNPIPIKTAMKVLGRDSGVLRLPLAEPSETVTARIKSLVAHLAREPRPALVAG